MVIDTRAFKNAKEYAPIIEACHKAHNVPTMEGHQDIKWMWLEKFDHAFPDDLNEHLTSRVKDASYPLLCNHCTNPPCVRVCPTQATYQMEDGIIAMDYHRCIGCRFCMAGCPFGARSFNFVDPRKYLSDPVPNPAYPTRMIGVVEKCTFCADRLRGSCRRPHPLRRSQRSQVRCVQGPRLQLQHSPQAQSGHPARRLLPHLGRTGHA